MSALKLFVVNETSPNPDEWHGYKLRAFVVANDPEEAVAIADCGNVAVEIPLEKSCLLGIVDERNDS